MASEHRKKVKVTLKRQYIIGVTGTRKERVITGTQREALAKVKCYTEGSEYGMEFHWHYQLLGVSLVPVVQGTCLTISEYIKMHPQSEVLT